MNPLPLAPAITIIRKAECDLHDVISTIGLDTPTTDNGIVAQGMRHISDLESITEYQMKDMSGMYKGYIIAILQFQR